MNITLVYSTARPAPRFDWFFDSFARCGGREQVNQIIVVDFFAQVCDAWTSEDCIARYKEVMNAAGSMFRPIVQWVPPKPNVWNGKYRLTPRNWWAVANARNTGLCLCKNDYVVFIDDRCVLVNTFMDAVREAAANNYAVCGTYEKRDGMEVDNGVITNPGNITGKDSRAEVAQGRKMICPGTWMFGHAFGLPTEWMLTVNGVDESWDSVSMEDTHFGQMLTNNHYPIYHDPRMAMVEDRSPSSPPHDMMRSSKEKHPSDKADKTHTLIKKLWDNKRSTHQWDLRKIREQALMGIPFPVPTGPTHDWFDNQPLSEMK
jgi:hypothetical protein